MAGFGSGVFSLCVHWRLHPQPMVLAGGDGSFRWGVWGRASRDCHCTFENGRTWVLSSPPVLGMSAVWFCCGRPPHHRVEVKRPVHHRQKPPEHQERQSPLVISSLTQVFVMATGSKLTQQGCWAPACVPKHPRGAELPASSVCCCATWLEKGSCVPSS